MATSNSQSEHSIGAQLSPLPTSQSTHTRIYRLHTKATPTPPNQTTSARHNTTDAQRSALSGSVGGGCASIASPAQRKSKAQRQRCTAAAHARHQATRKAHDDARRKAQARKTGLLVPPSVGVSAWMAMRSASSSASLFRLPWSSSCAASHNTADNAEPQFGTKHIGRGCALNREKRKLPSFHSSQSVMRRRLTYASTHKPITSAIEQSTRCHNAFSCVGSWLSKQRTHRQSCSRPLSRPCCSSRTLHGNKTESTREHNGRKRKGREGRQLTRGRVGGEHLRHVRHIQIPRRNALSNTRTTNDISTERREPTQQRPKDESQMELRTCEYSAPEGFATSLISSAASFLQRERAAITTR